MKIGTIKCLLETGDGQIFDIGQIKTEGLRFLEKEVKAGRVTKTKALWPWVTWGTCKKTLYQRSKL